MQFLETCHVRVMRAYVMIGCHEQNWERLESESRLVTKLE